MPETTSLPLVRVTEIGEYVHHHSCERRFRLEHNDRSLAAGVPFFYQLSSSIDPVLQEAGRRREEEWEAQVRGAGLRDLCEAGTGSGRGETPWEVFALRAAALAAGEEAFGREVLVSGELGDFRVSGRMDFVLLRWRDGRPFLRIVECKASRRDRTSHRVQVALYRMLLRRLLGETPLTIAGITLDPGDIECVVARIDEVTSAVADVFALPPLALETEEEDAATLLASGGELRRILARPLDDLDYCLDSRCGDCAFAVHCFPESARQRRLELLGLEPAAVRALREEGVRDLDALAGLDLQGEAAPRVRAHPGFSEDLEALVVRARARRSTLPGGAVDPDAVEVAPLPHAGRGQLPPHETGGQRLIRVYVSVHYDYVENRIGALAAHVTASDRPLSTTFRRAGERWEPIPGAREQWKDESGAFRERELSGEDLVGFPARPWSGDYDDDTEQETRLVQAFFQHVVRVVRDAATGPEAPIHFYVWSRQEMARLVEACSRCGTELLGHLRELLGCRAGLEQLIYSCLEDEIHTRYALGWTGRGLLVATSLRWFGRRFHWTREVRGEVVALDRAFEQDHFDFKRRLRYRRADHGYQWRPLDDTSAVSHTFEVRGSFQDALPAPYWRAHWGTLPDTGTDGPGDKVGRAVANYRAAGQPGYLRAYLAARAQALRWIEEGVRFKNDQIEKPPLLISSLPDFSLQVDDPSRAARDFLSLEQHVKVNDWIAAHLAPPLQRIPGGRSLPLRDVRPLGQNRLEGWLDPGPHSLGLQDLAVRSSIQDGGFVRLTPGQANPAQPQSLGDLFRGSTCIVDALDWETGRVELNVIPGRRDEFRLSSRSWSDDAEPWPHATLDDSPSDFVANRVYGRLSEGLGEHALAWFDPCGARIPAQTSLDPATRTVYEDLLARADLGRGPLAADQAEAALAGLEGRVQLLQGPPGTGKTQTTAAATLLRVLHGRRTGDVVLIAANTHTAVDELLSRIQAVLPRFSAAAAARGLQMPPVTLARLEREGSPGVTRLNVERITPFREMCAQSVVIAGGTANGILKLAAKAGGPTTAGFQAPILVVDEASMMVFPMFLALASLVEPHGEILLAGDHRQLAPIVAHDWAQEDRPPMVTYQPYVSAYEAVRRLKDEQQVPDAEITRSALTYSFRLPAAIRSLLARLYRMDDIHLAGRDPVPEAPCDCADPWERIWRCDTGVFLITHSERDSKESNPAEAALIRKLLEVGQHCGATPPGSVGLVMPHRAQRALLRTHLAGFTGDDGPVDVLDTVERLQGGERDTIIVSATASDPAAIGARAEFILNLQRANVAFSRARRRLVVVCAETLLSHIPAEAEHYQAAVLWKSLRGLCCEPVAQVTLGAWTVRIRAVPP